MMLRLMEMRYIYPIEMLHVPIDVLLRKRTDTPDTDQEREKKRAGASNSASPSPLDPPRLART